MPTAAELAAMMPPVPGLDPGQAQAANEATNAFLNPPPAPPPASPFSVPSPAELAGMGIAYAPVAPSQGQQMAQDFVSPPPAPPQPVPGMAPQAPAPAPVPHAGSHAQPGMVQQFDQMINKQQAQEQAAATELANTQRQGGVDTAAALKEQQAKRDANTAELIKKQQEVQAHNQALDAIDKANLDKAKNATIPDFWKDRTGALVGSTISVALAGIGAGLLGSTNNEALKNIQHSVDTYFHNQKDRIDNLYKYAEQTGKLNTQTRLNYAQDLLNLKDQHSYVMQSAADHVQEVAAKSKGAADAATTNFLSSKLGEQAIKDKQDVRELRSKILLQGAQAANARADAEEHKARAANGGYLTPAQVMQNSFRFGGELNKSFESVTRKGGLNEEAHSLAANIKLANEQPNNPAPFVGMMDSIVSAYSHGKVTQQQYNTWLKHIAPGADSFEQAKEQFLNGKASPTQRKNLMDIAMGKFNTVRGEIKDAYDQYEQVTSGQEFDHPVMKQLKDRKKVEIFGRSPGFGGKEPDLGTGQQAPAAATAQTQHNTVVRLKDGTTAEFNAAGQRVK